MLLRADSTRIPLRTGSVHVTVTSPPYWGLRSYGDDDRELGTEDLHRYLERLVDVMAEVRRLDEIGDVWHFSPVRGKYRGPAPYPDELVERCLRPSTLPRDLVLDPFAGSGTTLRVATRMGRIPVGLDLYAGATP